MAKKTTKQVGEIVATEGLGYAISDYLSWENIEDRALARRWKIAEIALNKIDKYLDEKLGE